MSKGPRVRRIPAGDNHERLVCPECDYIAYENPTVVVGSVVTRGEEFLLCRRSIEPRRGCWTLPAGFLELQESPEAGARREAKEEASADIGINALLAVYTVMRTGQIQLMYRAHLLSEPKAGHETLEVRMVTWDEIPWDEIAFPSVHWALHQHQETRHLETFPPFTNPPGQRGGFDELGNWP